MENYKELQKRVWTELKKSGFKKHGTTFYLFSASNIGVINFQRVTKNFIGSNAFTINLGVSSTKIRKIEDRSLDQLPTVSECHWRQRIGFLMPEKQDHWWDITLIEDIDSFSVEIISLLQKIAIPEIIKNISDGSLLESFRAGKGQGLSVNERWKYLIALLSFYDINGLNQSVVIYWKYAGDNRLLIDAKFHLERLGIAIPKS